MCHATTWIALKFCLRALILKIKTLGRALTSIQALFNERNIIRVHAKRVKRGSKITSARAREQTQRRHTHHHRHCNHSHSSTSDITARRALHVRAVQLELFFELATASSVRRLTSEQKHTKKKLEKRSKGSGHCSSGDTTRSRCVQKHLGVSSSS